MSLKHVRGLAASPGVRYTLKKDDAHARIARIVEAHQEAGPRCGDALLVLRQ
ncbi:MAG TPA: hypothetical protein VK039_04030 [Brevibacterium sp.]|nr:hypothetical protein [Brevibacterium sp.]